MRRNRPAKRFLCFSGVSCGKGCRFSCFFSGSTMPPLGKRSHTRESASSRLRHEGKPAGNKSAGIDEAIHCISEVQTMTKAANEAAKKSPAPATRKRLPRLDELHRI